MIINIRGCNGSGKTHAARSLLDAPPRWVGGKGPYGFTVGERVALVGPYEAGKCGGCDRIKTFEDMRNAIMEAEAQWPIVIFEGVILSTVFGSWADFCKAHPFVWAFLDTPLSVCLARIQARNGNQPIKEGLVRDKLESILRVKYKAKQAGYRVETIHYEQAEEELRRLINE